ncbi:MAG: 30S ribosomal protein S17 [Candidatus Nezhaarchaeota archaeon]|nr:30S ribosomal protein S17 [Candidatus Nezhaarchaeota archaeon]
MSGTVKARNVGVPGVQVPEKACNDVDCPYHGSLSVRGKILEGTLISVKMRKTATILHEYTLYVKKYERYERRRKKIHAHLPPCLNVNVGDKVIVGECRPLAKTVSFVVLGKFSPTS